MRKQKPFHVHFTRVILNMDKQRRVLKTEVVVRIKLLRVLLGP